MEDKKQVLMVMPVMKGGGAERVAALLMNEFYKNKYEVKFLLTSSKQEDVISRDLRPEIPMILLQDRIETKKCLPDYLMKCIRLYGAFASRVMESFGLKVFGHFAYCSFLGEYYKEISALRKIIQEHPNTSIITFLQPSIPLVLLAAKGLPNKVIISERGNPGRLMKHRYGWNFIKKYYKRADVIVFQTEDAKNTYPREISDKGTIIYNPIKSDLPKRYSGERKKNITTFCRISKQKNLPMMLEAFSLLNKEFPEFRLRIIGDALTEEGKKVSKQLHEIIKNKKLEKNVDFIPFCKDVHELVLYDTMYANSSDYEGMCNAMLEAMAIGLPVVCTDCPIGGASAVINDEKNGLLVPVGDVNAMYLAMKKIIENPVLAELISESAVKIRHTQSLENIAQQWMELV